MKKVFLFLLLLVITSNLTAETESFELVRIQNPYASQNFFNDVVQRELDGSLFALFGFDVNQPLKFENDFFDLSGKSSGKITLLFIIRKLQDRFGLPFGAHLLAASHGPLYLLGDTPADTGQTSTEENSTKFKEFSLMGIEIYNIFETGIDLFAGGYYEHFIFYGDFFTHIPSNFYAIFFYDPLQLLANISYNLLTEDIGTIVLKWGRLFLGYYKDQQLINLMAEIDLIGLVDFIPDIYFPDNFDFSEGKIKFRFEKALPSYEQPLIKLGFHTSIDPTQNIQPGDDIGFLMEFHTQYAIPREHRGRVYRDSSNKLTFAPQWFPYGMLEINYGEYDWRLFIGVESLF